MDQLDLTVFFKTKLQAHDFSSRLSLIMSKVYSNDFKIEKELQEQLGIEKKDKFIILLRDHNITLQSPGPLKEFMEKIIKTTLELPTLSLTLAFEPKQENLATFSEWFLLNIKKQILLDIKVDQNLIGGALVSFNGKYLDGSVKSVFEQTVNTTTIPRPQIQAQTAPQEKVAEVGR